MASVVLHSQSILLCRTSVIETDIIGGNKAVRKGEKERPGERLLELLARCEYDNSGF